MPEENKLVLCTITKIYHNSVFALLDVYNKQGMIHISEISPGRIRNIRDYVKEGKKVVCKILRIDPVKGHIDLSLRRVNENQRKIKLNQIKQELKAEKLIEHFAKTLNKPFKELYTAISIPILHKYEYIHQCFKDIVEGKAELKDMDIERNLAKKLTQVIIEKIKPEKVSIHGELSLISYEPDGVDIVKQALAMACQISKKQVIIKYKGSGKYDIFVTAPNYKEAEAILQQSADSAIDFIKKAKGIGNFKK